MKIGVLGFQGTVREHVDFVEKCGEEALIVLKEEQLKEIDGLILPSGEFSTMRRLIVEHELLEPLRAFAFSGKPVFGTGSGFILLAKKIVGYFESHLDIMDLTIEQNLTGQAMCSFEAHIDIAGIGEDFHSVFICPSQIVNVGENVEILAKYGGQIVMAKEENILGCTFHPELGEDDRITQYFIEMVRNSTN